MRVCHTCNKEKSLDEFYSGKCYKDGYDIYCKSCARARRLNNDRNPINPVSKGGDLIINNVQLLCKSCNCSKGNKMIKYRDDINIIGEVTNG